MMKIKEIAFCGLTLILFYASPCLAQTSGGSMRTEEVGGIAVEYDISAKNADEIIKLMNSFMIAYATADREALTQCLTEDFLWHLHEGSDNPNGMTVKGIDGMMTILAYRRTKWSNVKYENIKIYATSNLVTQTFRISGHDESGKKFDVNAVDLYPMRDGKIAGKSSYWKRIH
jgi:ketosteroid isomerase-like protein